MNSNKTPWFKYCGSRSNFRSNIRSAIWTSSFLWIVLGCIFAGAVHDYLTGMISIRYGALLPALASKFLGKSFSHVVNFFTVLLLLLVGTVLFRHRRVW
jgi:carbon starvation protein CstA